MPAIDNLKAMNAAFGYSFPKEVAHPDNVPPNKTCKDVSVLNIMKTVMYVPVLSTALCADVMKGVFKKNSKASIMDKMLCARAVIAESSFLGKILLIIADIFYTILVKPFVNLAVFILNKKAEKEAQAAKLLEEQTAQNSPQGTQPIPIPESQNNSPNATSVNKNEKREDDALANEIINVDQTNVSVVAHPKSEPKPIEIIEDENSTKVNF